MLKQSKVKNLKKKQFFLVEQRIILLKKDVNIFTKTHSMNLTNINTKYILCSETINRMAVMPIQRIKDMSKIQQIMKYCNITIHSFRSL